MRTAALHNLGCKVNAYETEAMRQILEEGGYRIVPFTEKADVYVINTCSVTNIADRKSRQMIHRARKCNPDAVIVATGCYVQAQTDRRSDGLGEKGRNTTSQNPDAQAENLGADIIIGNNRKHELLAVLDEFFQMQSDIREACNCKMVHVTNINDSREPYEELTVAALGEHTRAFVKVQDGCNQFCSYCIIPYVRGRVRSRSMENVLKEVCGLAVKGYREVVLTGIHLSSYGVDLQASLLELIRAVCAVDGIERVRLGSLEPKIVTEDFARELAAMPKVCPHFHLSLQSGCDETLSRMNRKYTTAEYEQGCLLLRKYFDNPAITTDVIVGFPGETEEEFSVTKRFLEHIHFYEMHVFKYSRRKGTRADRMPDQVPEPVKAVRSEELIALGERMSQEYRKQHIGLQREVLLEEATELNGGKYFVGYTPEYIRVAAPINETLANGTPVNETPVKETPMNETPMNETPMKEIPMNETLMKEGCIVTGRIIKNLEDDLYLLEC